MTLPDEPSLKDQINNFLNKDHNKIRFYIFLTILGIAIFLVIGFTLPVKKKELSRLKETKPPTHAAGLPSGSLLGWPNNIFGMYSYRDTESINLTAELVNSNGGDWGWILLPMNIKDRDLNGWSGTFNTLRAKRLIPIIQLVLDPGYIPTTQDIESAADFLNRFSWPTRQRFVTAFNEVNAAEYWGNQIDPEGYALILDKFITSFRGRSGDFFLLNGAFNPSARTGVVTTNLGVRTEYLDIRDYLKRVDAKSPGIFKRLDGWAVHTYPQPEYKGKPLDKAIAGESEEETGRNTMGSYKWELNILRKEYGADLPVFITETGWPHKEGAVPKPEWLGQNTVANYYQSVFTDLYLQDPQVVAVIPFGMKIDNLDNFSFVGKTGTRYLQFDYLKSLPKDAGTPPTTPTAFGPVISSFNPVSGGPVGTKAVVNGVMFGVTPGVVSFSNGAVGNIINWTNNQITFTVPAGAVSGKIKITDSNGLGGRKLPRL